LGSYEVVWQAIQADTNPLARIGTRLKDFAIMIDLDMLGSLNFVNYIYNATEYIPPNTPLQAYQGSKILTDLFGQFYDENGLPRDADRFDGRSDYGPFLVAGIPAGGVDAGADKTKTAEQLQRYYSVTGWGGIQGVILDQCYHRACDTIANIHWGCYTNMSRSAAYVLEILAQKQNLRQWLGNPLDAPRIPGPYDHLPFAYRFDAVIPKHVDPSEPVDFI